MATVYKPTNFGWGNAATVAKKPAAKPRVSQAVTYQPTNPGWGAAATAAKPAGSPLAPQIGQPLGPVTLTAANAYDYQADPVLQQIRSGSARSRAEARAAELAARKRLAILFGDTSGIVDDDATAEAARQNAFSTLAELRRAYERGRETLDEQYNQANLFYGGHRARALARALEGYQRGQYEARNALQDQLTGVNRELLAALAAADAADRQAENDAANRALTRALEYGIDPGQGVAAAPAAQPAAPTVAAALDPLSAARRRRLELEGF